MERKRTPSSVNSAEEQAPSRATNGQAELISVAQIQNLVRLLDHSDISELELKQANEGIHLVLRKVKAQEGVALAGEVAYVASSNGATPAGEPASAASQHTVAAPLVGIFHPWLKPRGGRLAAVGGRVKAGQLIGTIESLNVFNEVETPVAGRIAEVHVQDGEPVEYGQVLITIDTSEVEGA